MQTEYTRLLELIEEEIARALPGEPDAAWFGRFFGALPFSPSPIIARALNAPSRELIGRGGKRWRPLLLVLCAHAFGREDGALSLTPVVELAHNGSLIVDDIEDGSDLRRGGPAIHLMFGVDAAVNDGNLLYFLPLSLIDEFPAPPELRLRLYQSYTAAMRRLHLGQTMDIQWHRSPEFLPPVEEYLSMCALKTGVLSRAAAELGALAAGASPEASSALGRLFESLGVAFQILDDVKNLRTGNPGKRRGDDIVEGKKSLPVLLASAKDPRIGRELPRCFAAARKGGIDAPEVEEAIGMIARTGALEDSEAKARGLLSQVREGIVGLVPSRESAEELLGIFPFLGS